MPEWRGRLAIGGAVVGCLILAVFLFVGLGVLGLLWFGLKQLF